MNFAQPNSNILSDLVYTFIVKFNAFILNTIYKYNCEVLVAVEVYYASTDFGLLFKYLNIVIGIENTI